MSRGGGLDLNAPPKPLAASARLAIRARTNRGRGPSRRGDRPNLRRYARLNWLGLS